MLNLRMNTSFCHIKTFAVDIRNKVIPDKAQKSSIQKYSKPFFLKFLPLLDCLVIEEFTLCTSTYTTYILYFPEEEFFSITTIGDGHSGGILHVAPIDRDYLQREVFRFTIIAYKYNNRY